MSEKSISNKIKVVIADDQAMVREGIKLLLSLDEEIEVIGMYQNGLDCIKALSEMDVHVVVMDIRMPQMDGICATKEIKSRYPHIKVLALTTFNDDKSIFEALKNGASGYLLKDAGSAELINAIKSINSGGTYLHVAAATKVIQRINSNQKTGPSHKLVVLTSREIEIARCVAEGLSNKETALRLYITEGTVKNHVSNILTKLGLTHRTQLVIYVRENDI